MKKNVLKVVSYLLVAVLASLVTMATVTYLDSGDSKLDQLENLIVERFIGEADRTAMEDAAADAVASTCLTLKLATTVLYSQLPPPLVP